MFAAFKQTPMPDNIIHNQAKQQRVIKANNVSVEVSFNDKCIYLLQFDKKITIIETFPPIDSKYEDGSFGSGKDKYKTWCAEHNKM